MIGVACFGYGVPFLNVKAGFGVDATSLIGVDGIGVGSEGVVFVGKENIVVTEVKDGDEIGLSGLGYSTHITIVHSN